MLNDPRITAIGLFAEAYAGLNARMTAQLDFEVLIRLARSPDCELRMTDLAAQTGLSTSGITRVVDRLERDGLAQRRACPTDRRGSFTVITEAGHDRLAAVVPGHVALIEEWFTGLLSERQLDDLLAALRVVRDAVRPDATAGVTAPATAK
jgi:MarR family 2-MHQ and catechol resistance regulon transcriptional repressor